MTSDRTSTGAEQDAPSRLASVARRGLLRCAVPLAQGGGGALVDELVSRSRELAGQGGRCSVASVAGGGLLRCAVPLAQGGDGALVDELVSRIRELAGQDMASARIAWAPRLAIEALVHSPNIALREHLLPDLLTGALAGTLSWRQDLTLASARSLVQAQPLERGWHLKGLLDDVPNLQWEGYVVVCPVRFDAQVGQPQRWAWVVLRSEEDGLRHVIDVTRAQDVATASGTVRLNNVYFREDELL